MATSILSQILKVYQFFMIFRFSKFQKSEKTIKNRLTNHRQTKRFGQNDRNNISVRFRSTSSHEKLEKLTNISKNIPGNPPIGLGGDAKRKQFHYLYFLCIAGVPKQHQLFKAEDTTEKHHIQSGHGPKVAVQGPKPLFSKI